jgi:hypothetical protein
MSLPTDPGIKEHPVAPTVAGSCQEIRLRGRQQAMPGMLATAVDFVNPSVHPFDPTLTGHVGLDIK